MAKSNHYEWLIVVEGISDVRTYESLLIKGGIQKTSIKLFPAKYKSSVCNAATWGKRDHKGSKLLDTVKNDVARSNFKGIILVVDSDESYENAFDGYKQNQEINYVPTKKEKVDDLYWRLDTINGVSEIPVFGISVPYKNAGCLESDLLNAFAFPVEGQPQYDSFVDIVKEVSGKWGIPKHGDGKEWWEVNQKAKLDKFIYLSLSYGFFVCHEELKFSKQAQKYYEAREKSDSILLSPVKRMNVRFTGLFVENPCQKSIENLKNPLKNLLTNSLEVNIVIIVEQ